MNREDIIRMARESGFEYSGAELSWESVICTDELERFAALVASAEREACIKIVEDEAMQYAEPVWAFEIVNDIKARGNVATNDTSQKRVDKTSEIVHEPEYLAFMDTPQRKPLTRKEVLAIIDKHPAEKKTGLPMFYRDQVLNIVRAIEAAHGIKGEA